MNSSIYSTIIFKEKQLELLKDLKSKVDSYKERGNRMGLCTLVMGFMDNSSYALYQNLFTSVMDLLAIEAGLLSSRDKEGHYWWVSAYDESITTDEFWQPRLKAIETVINRLEKEIKDGQ